MQSDEAIKNRRLLDKIAYQFNNNELLERALTHSSAQDNSPVASDNERLEFLGDRVLGLVIATMLLRTFPKASEGELARRYNRLVRKQMCADIAVEWNLGDHLLLSSGEERSGGRVKSTILADACEAMLGAVYLDGGYEVAFELIERFWKRKMLEGGNIELDSKTALQEWVQGKGLPLPIYQTISRSGPDHAPHFRIQVSVDNFGCAEGEGGSKREAEQQAALQLLTEKKNCN